MRARPANRGDVYLRRLRGRPGGPGRDRDADQLGRRLRRPAAAGRGRVPLGGRLAAGGLVSDPDVALVTVFVAVGLILIDEARSRFQSRSLVPYAVIVLAFGFLWVTR